MVGEKRTDGDWEILFVAFSFVEVFLGFLDRGQDVWLAILVSLPSSA